MYKIEHTLNGRTYHDYRKTDKQAKTRIAELKERGYKDIGMVRMSAKQIRQLKRGK